MCECVQTTKKSTVSLEIVRASRSSAPATVSSSRGGQADVGGGGRDDGHRRRGRRRLMDDDHDAGGACWRRPPGRSLCLKPPHSDSPCRYSSSMGSVSAAARCTDTTPEACVYACAQYHAISSPRGSFPSISLLLTADVAFVADSTYAAIVKGDIWIQRI